MITMKIICEGNVNKLVFIDDDKPIIDSIVRALNEAEALGLVPITSELISVKPGVKRHA